VSAEEDPAERRVRIALEADERIQIRAAAIGAVLAVTDRRVAIVDERRLVLDTPFEGLRRIQFDIERDRPATLVVVPESPSQPPQVLAIPPREYDRVTQALAVIGRRIVRA
jgi:hypothetical protein